MEDFALFGGSFNPIHKGHLNIIKYVLDHADIDKVIVIPAFISPFKTKNEGASSTDRLNMIHLSINDFFKDTPYINRIVILVPFLFLIELFLLNMVLSIFYMR